MSDGAALDRQITISWGDRTPLLEAQKRMPWIDVLRAMVAGDIPLPPSFQLFGMKPIAVEPGVVTFAIDPEPQHYNLIDCLHGGILAALGDTAAGLAVHSALPFGMTCATLELHINFIRPVRIETGRITCVGRVIHQGQRTATAEARITDANGKLYAHFGTTLMVSKLATE